MAKKSQRTSKSKSLATKLQKQAPGRRHRCTTCRHEASATAISEWLKMRDAGTTDWSAAELWKYHLRPDLNYPMGKEAMYRHIRECEGHEKSNGTQ